MDKTFYELLEVDKNASSEVIDKAYKTLVKKYHPDLKDISKKEENEEIIKKINEAYEILSDNEKRLKYNKLLEKQYISIEEYNNLYNENLYLKNQINSMYTQKENINNAKMIKNHQNFNTQINDIINKAYHDAYIQDLKNRGYKIKYKKNFKDYLKALLIILIIFICFFIAMQIPFIRNYFISIYNENSLIKFFIDIILNIFNI